MNGDRQNMILSNIGIARNTLSIWCRKNHAEPKDYEASAMIGLIKAVDAFDPSKGFAFSTCAVRRILAEIIDQWRKENCFWHFGWRRRPSQSLGFDPVDPANNQAVETSDMVAFVMGGLSPGHQRLIHDRFWAGLGRSRIALDWGVSRRSIYREELAAMNQMRRHLFER